jgi:hypothetical protein
MKGFARRNRRGVGHLPLGTGQPGVIHTICGWVLNKPERWKPDPSTGEAAPSGPICAKCTARRG